MAVEPSFGTASRNKKGRCSLIKSAIRLLKAGNTPEALGCLIAYEKRRKAERTKAFMAAEGITAQDIAETRPPD